ncbi:hypothetical protein LXA43DRAFT_1094917 [Ganoderma leucocontextum]|nr:hypothetical protein LXA43DRAFT_1094917 [Ganoderma leucocontextum]
MPASQTSSSTPAATHPASVAASPQAGQLDTNSRRTFSERDHNDSDPDSEDERPAPKKTRRRKTESALAAAGAAAGMMGDLFRDFQAILDAGLQANAHSPATALGYRERKYVELFAQLLGIMPSIVNEVTKHGPKGTMLVARELEAGHQGVRGVDLHGIKKAILTWDNYEPAILPEAKSVRGFNHPMCGLLLCPVSYDWGDDVVRAGLQNRSVKYPAGSKDFMYVLWQDEKVDPENFVDGFLRNRRLIMTSRFVLLGPRAVHGLGNMAARKPKARIHRIRSITVGFIAYTAVLVHFSLSSQESFSDGSTAGTFPYEEFYQSLVRYVEETMLEEERTSLLTWWNIQIFGQLDEDTWSDDENTESSRPWSVMARMKAQAAAKVVATREGRAA